MEGGLLSEICIAVHMALLIGVCTCGTVIPASDLSTLSAYETLEICPSVNSSFHALSLFCPNYYCCSPLNLISS